MGHDTRKWGPKSSGAESRGSEMDAALAKGGRGEKYFIFAGPIFAKGTQPKKKLRVFFFCTKTTPCAGNYLFSQIIRICMVNLPKL